MNKEEVYSNCLASLVDSGFQVVQIDPHNGIISSVKDGDFPLYFSLLDVRVIRDKYAVIVSVISSNLSKLFGNFYHNRIDEETFVEHFLDRLRKATNGNFESAFFVAELV